jgi:GT2 family glycosyltransferase
MGLIQVTIPSISWPEFLNSCVESILRQEGVTIEDIVIVCNSERTIPCGHEWMERGATVYCNPRNLGCTGTWNLGSSTAWTRGYSANFMIGDDVVLNDSTGIRRLEEKVVENPNRLISVASLGFTAWVVTKQVWDIVGELDEGFWPAYYEDNDYHRRICLAGMGDAVVEVAHAHYGSGSLRKWKEWEDWNAHYAFMVNGDRFRAKWGGYPGAVGLVNEPWGGHPEYKWDTKDRLKSMGTPPPPWGW